MLKDTKRIPVVILCGGMGTRMKEETEFRPKPLVEIGGRPIIWHIMKLYSHFGFVNFILCLGYKGELIKEYFLNYEAMNNDFTINLGSQNRIDYHNSHREENWNVTLIDTGLDTLTGGRIKKIEHYVKNDTFMVTYGDGISDINIHNLLQHHYEKKTIGTLTGVHPVSRFGVLMHNHSDIVTGFKEKPYLNGLVNGGFFVFEKSFFNYLTTDSVLESEPLENLAKENQLSVYKHNGFWRCMDTFKDVRELNYLWETKMPWKIWRG
jgi:glucose-1-phosphate cytidylyltransferase